MDSSSWHQLWAQVPPRIKQLEPSENRNQNFFRSWFRLFLLSARSIWKVLSYNVRCLSSFYVSFDFFVQELLQFHHSILWYVIVIPKACSGRVCALNIWVAYQMKTASFWPDVLAEPHMQNLSGYLIPLWGPGHRSTHLWWPYLWGLWRASTEHETWCWCNFGDDSRKFQKPDDKKCNSIARIRKGFKHRSCEGLTEEDPFGQTLPWLKGELSQQAYFRLPACHTRHTYW